MNRLVDYTQPDSIVNTRHSEGLYQLDYESVQKIRISKKDIDSGQSQITIPFTNNDGLVFPVTNDTEWVIDMATVGINQQALIGGVLDGLGMVTEKYYHIWAFATSQGISSGFGLMQQPTSTFQCASTAKGLEITLTNLTKAYRFVIGSRLQVLHNNVTTAVNDTDWNLATVTSVDSATQIKALLDNNKVFGQTYGATIPVQGGTGGLITQLDRFRPHIADDSTQATIHPYYRVIGILKTDTTASPNTKYDGFSVYPFKDQSLRGKIDAWHPDLSGNTALLDESWQLCDGLIIKNDRTPLIGTVLPDLTGDDRFLRGSTTSGTIQAATISPRVVSFDSGGGVRRIYSYGNQSVTNEDTAVGSIVTPHFANHDGQAGTNLSPGYTARPVNMSVVWIIKVR